MASVEPQKYIYSFQTKTSSTPPDSNAAYMTSKEKREDLAFKWHYSGKQHRGIPIWQRATDRKLNPAYNAYNKAKTAANNAALADQMQKTINPSAFYNKTAKHAYAARLTGQPSEGLPNVNNVGALANSMDKVTIGGKQSKKRSTKKGHTKKRSTRHHRKSLKKTIRRRR
jgi:hypothetical protein